MIRGSGDEGEGDAMTKATEEMLALADKIEYSIKTEGEITLFETNGTRVVYVLRSLAAQSVGEPSNIRDRLAGDGDCKTWIREHLDYPHDWCLIWPFARNQAGYATFGEPPRKVHRTMCEHRHGAPPTLEHHAAHSCDRGHEGCVNQRHLDWKTASENEFDKSRRGGIRKQRKLTADQAREIRDLKGLEHTNDTAARFGISESNVRHIQNGETWRRTSGRMNHVFTREEFFLIRETPWRVKTAKQWAEEFGVHVSAIDRIRGGKSHRHFLVEQALAPATTSEDNRS